MALYVLIDGVGYELQSFVDPVEIVVVGSLSFLRNKDWPHPVHATISLRAKLCGTRRGHLRACSPSHVSESAHDE